MKRPVSYTHPVTVRLRLKTSAVTPVLPPLPTGGGWKTKGASGHAEWAPSPGARKLDGAGEARLIALACSAAPDGRVAWPLEMLADELVELTVVASICPETVRQTLKKTRSSRG